MNYILRSFFSFFLSVFSLCLFNGCAPFKKKMRSKNNKKTSIALRSTITNVAIAPEKKNSQKIKNDLLLNEDQAVLLDQIVCRVNGVNIMESDLNKARIDKDGAQCSLDELIAEELLWQKATELKCIPTANEIDHRLTSIKQVNGLLNATEEEFQSWLLNEARLTTRDLQQQLMRIGAATHVKQWNAQEQSIVSEKEKKDFYAAHDFLAPTEYHLQVGYIDTKELSLESIDPSTIEWTDVGWIAEPDLATEMSEIKSLNLLALSTPLKLDDRYQVVQLLEKKESRKKSYEESESVIEKKILRKKQKVADKLLVEKLRERASIIFLKK